MSLTNPPETLEDTPPAALSSSPVLLGLLAVAAGLTVANIYYCQPLLGTLAATFQVGVSTVTAVATATQLGYATGLLLIVPLADSLERRRLITGCTMLSAAALAGAAFAPTISWLIAASFVVGVVSMTAQLAVTYAAGLAAPERRGRTVGVVMSGLLIGILLSRTVSGAVGEHFGWRTVYILGCGVMLALAALLAVSLPVQKPLARVSYGQLLASTWSLVRDEPVLRRHALIGALGFAAFSAFWTTLAFHLASLPAHYGSKTAGLFGLVGAAGALAAAVSGRLADRIGPRILNGSALGLMMLSFALMGFSDGSLVALAIGVVLMDAGVQGSHISNQTRIYALSAEKRNRLNAVYMVTYFVGGALGSVAGSVAWERFGWSGVCEAGAVFGLLGLAVLFLSARSTQQQPHSDGLSPKILGPLP